MTITGMSQSELEDHGRITEILQTVRRIEKGGLLKDKRIEELEAELAEANALIDRTIEWKESMPELILKNFLRENYLPLSNLIDDMRKAREVK